jgi:C_GCAxxG_C_C family probable redox protein
MSKSEVAVEAFRGGANCSQAVLGAYAEEHGLTQELALKIACGFGGGVGRLGHTCGAVNGAVMALGLVASNAEPSGVANKIRVYGLVQSFVEQFEARHNTTLCRELLGCDISTPQGYTEATASGVFATLCPEYVRDAVEILEELLDRP